MILSGSTADAVGPVYTIPAEYETIKKVVQGLTGRDNLTSLSTTVAKNIGANIRSFVEGAVDVNITATSPTYFKSYGRNYAYFFWGATGYRPAGFYNSQMAFRAGSSIKNLISSLTGDSNITNTNTPLHSSIAGRNLRQFFTNLTGKTLSTSSGNEYYFAGLNLKKFVEGMVGRTITSSSPSLFANTGESVRNFINSASGKDITTSSPSEFTSVGKGFYWSRRRADQAFYDLYLNPKGLKNYFNTIPNDVKSATLALAVINKGSEFNLNLGGGEGKGGKGKGGEVEFEGLGPNTTIAKIEFFSVYNSCSSGGYGGYDYGYGGGYDYGYGGDDFLCSWEKGVKFVSLRSDFKGDSGTLKYKDGKEVARFITVHAGMYESEIKTKARDYCPAGNNLYYVATTEQHCDYSGYCTMGYTYVCLAKDFTYKNQRIYYKGSGK
jgi:hypothetical protein